MSFAGSDYQGPPVWKALRGAPFVTVSPSSVPDG